MNTAVIGCMASKASVFLKVTPFPILRFDLKPKRNIPPPRPGSSSQINGLRSSPVFDVVRVSELIGGTSFALPRSCTLFIFFRDS